MSKRKRLKVAQIQYVIAVCRKSRDREDKQVQSLPDQEKINTEHYNKLPKEIRGKHPLKIVSIAKTAFEPDQPYLLELCAMADRGEVYGVQSVFENRISRNHEDTGRFVQRLCDGRIPYFETTSGKRYTGQNSGEIFMLCLEGAMSWKDSKDKGTIVLQRMELRAAEGKHMGRKPFGFLRGMELRSDGSEVRTTIPDPERLPYVIEMYRMASTGTYSLTDLEKWAAKRAIRARPAKNNPTGSLKRNAIFNILHDSYYKGLVRFNGKMSSWKGMKGAPAIDPPISEELWNRVQLALLQRCTNTARVKAETLRKRFIYGSTVRCGKCGGTLSPYKVEKKNGKAYIYYECKNRKTRCKETIAQDMLEKQYASKVFSADVPESELNRIRGLLLNLHKEKSTSRVTRHEELTVKYKEIEKKITDQLAGLKKAEDMGVGKEAETSIKELAQQRDTVCRQMAEAQEEGTEWIEKTIRSFELLKLTKEAMKHGSPQIREAILKAIASNYELVDGKLIPELRSPFKQASQREGRLEWWAIQDSNL